MALPSPYRHHRDPRALRAVRVRAGLVVDQPEREAASVALFDG
jgi:hypothetical protein